MVEVDVLEVEALMEEGLAVTQCLSFSVVPPGFLIDYIWIASFICPSNKGPVFWKCVRMSQCSAADPPSPASHSSAPSEGATPPLPTHLHCVSIIHTNSKYDDFFFCVETHTHLLNLLSSLPPLIT